MRVSKFNTIDFNNIAKKGLLSKEISITSDLAVFISALPVSSHNILIYVTQYLSEYIYMPNSGSFSDLALKLVNTCLIKRI